MGSFQNQMFRVVKQCFFVLCRSAPEHENNRTIQSIDCPDCSICKLLPADSPVGIGIMCPNRKNGIQQKHSLIRPFFQISVVGNTAAQIIMQLLIDIHQGRRNLHLRFYGKTQPVGLTIVVIGILPQNHHLYLSKRCKIKCIENIIGIRKNLIILIFIPDPVIQILIIRLFEFLF